LDKLPLGPKAEVGGIDYLLDKISQHYPPKNRDDELLLEVYEQLWEKHFRSVPSPMSRNAPGR
jgi:hypothetical protein